MVPITRWIILLAFRTAGDWLRCLPRNQPFFISINISATGLRDAGLGKYVASLLRETKLPPSLLMFELTEASLISNVAAALETLEQLHAMGTIL
jgi:EAL domain-containing protein (putative c-di-GMP-specific phosphodiesterase class I)